jgi:hypothetical protein
MNTLRNPMVGILILVALIMTPVTALAAFDTAQPTTTATLTGTKGSDGWYTTSVTITLVAADGTDGSGVAKTEYSLDNATWQAYSVPFVLDKDGDQYVYFRSTDQAGNVESPAKSQEIKINKAGLVGWWKMDGDWKDASLMGNDLTPANNPTSSSDAKVGTLSAKFNGSNTYLRRSTGNSLPFGKSPRTLMAWIKPFSYPDSTFNGIIAYGQMVNGNKGSMLSIKNDGRLSMASWWNDAHQTVGTPATLNQWNHVAFTYAGGTTVRFYMNGQFVQESALTAGTPPNTQDGPLRIGSADDPGRIFNGLIDEASIYNRALSDTEILEHYRNYVVKSPTVNPVPSPTATPTITLSGTKSANTAIMVNGSTKVPLEGPTSWQTTYTLSQGMNTISITALDSQNFNSLPVALTVVLDTTPPQITATTPANNGIFMTAPGAVTFTLADAFSPLNYTATLNGATVRNASGLTIAGTWSSSGSGTAGTITFTPIPALSEGTYTFVIKPTDSLGNGSNYTLTFTIDSTPPVAPGIDPVTVPINTASKNITGTKSSDSASVVVSGAGATIGTISYPTATIWSVNLSGLKVGSNTITAYAVDTAGNQSATATATIIVDTTPPAVGATPAGGIYNSTQSVVLAANEPAVIYYTTDGSTPTASATMYSQPIAIPASATLRYFVLDLAGNNSEIKTENYVIDTTPPVLAISTLRDEAYTNNETLNIAGTVTDNTGVTGVTVNDTAMQVNPDGSFSYALLLKNGVNSITIAATDSAGNMAADTRTVTLDQASPVLAVTTPADNSKTGKALLEVSGTVDETSAVTIKIKDNMQSALMNGGAFTATLILEPGYNTIEITAADLAGNQSSLKRTVVFDDQVPSLALTVPNQDIRTNKGSLAIKGTVHDPLTAVGVTISKDNEILTPPVIDGSFEQALNFTEEKTYGIVVTATNEVGTSASVQRNVIYDITPPALSIDPVATPTNQPSQSVRGTREAGAAVTVTCAMATVGEVSYPTATTWQADISFLREGENVIIAASADAAGNAVRATATVVLATKLPEITITATPDVIWPPNHQMVPVTIAGGVEAYGSDIKSVSISVSDEYGKFECSNLTFGSTVMLEAWRNGNDADGRKYTITVVVTDKGGITTTKTATVTVPHDKLKLKKSFARP